MDTSLYSRPFSQEQEENNEDNKDVNIKEDKAQNSVENDVVPSTTISKSDNLENTEGSAIDDDHEVSFQNLLSGRSGVRSNSISLEEFQASRKRALGQDIGIGVGNFESISEFSPDELHDLPTSALDFPIDEHIDVDLHSDIIPNQSHDAPRINDANIIDSHTEGSRIGESGEEAKIEESSEFDGKSHPDNKSEVESHMEEEVADNEADEFASPRNENTKSDSNLDTSNIGFTEKVEEETRTQEQNETEDSQNDKTTTNISSADTKNSESRHDIDSFEITIDQDPAKKSGIPQESSIDKNDDKSIERIDSNLEEESDESNKEELNEDKEASKLEESHREEKSNQENEVNEGEGPSEESAIKGEESNQENIVNSEELIVAVESGKEAETNQEMRTEETPQNVEYTNKAEELNKVGEINKVDDTNKVKEINIDVEASTENASNTNDDIPTISIQQEPELDKLEVEAVNNLDNTNFNSSDKDEKIPPSTIETSNNSDSGSSLDHNESLVDTSTQSKEHEQVSSADQNDLSVPNVDSLSQNSTSGSSHSEELSKDNILENSLTNIDNDPSLGEKEDTEDIETSSAKPDLSETSKESSTKVAPLNVEREEGQQTNENNRVQDGKESSITDADIKVANEGDDKNNDLGASADGNNEIQQSSMHTQTNFGDNFEIDKEGEHLNLDSKDSKVDTKEMNTSTELPDTEKDKNDENMKLDLPENLDHDQLVKLLELDSKHTDIFEDNEMLDDDGLGYDEKVDEEKKGKTLEPLKKLDTTIKDKHIPEGKTEKKDDLSSNPKNVNASKQSQTNQEGEGTSQTGNQSVSNEGDNIMKTPPLGPIKDDAISPGQHIQKDGDNRSTKLHEMKPPTIDQLPLKEDGNSNTPASIINEKNSLLYPKRQNSLTPMVFQQHEIKNTQQLQDNQEGSKNDSAEAISNTNQPTIFAYARLDFQSFTFYVQTLHAIIGRRSENDFSHKVDVNLGPSKAISRRHAQIFYNFGTGRFELSIIGKNGAFVDDIFVERGNTVPLKNKSKIQIGQIPFQFILPEPDVIPSPNKDATENTENKIAVNLEKDEKPASKTEGNKEVNKKEEPKEIKELKREPGSTDIKKEKTAPPKPSPKKSKPKPTPPPPTPPPKVKKPVKEPKKVYKPEEIPPEYRVKPTLNYSTMLTACIRKYSKAKGMSLSEIYAGIRELYPYFKYCPDGWQSSVRHNLSLNKSFRKVSKEGKGWLWGLDEEYIAEREVLKQKQKEVIETKQPAADKKSETKKSTPKTTTPTTSKVVKKQNISQTLAANRANANKGQNMDDHQRTMKYLQEQLVILTKDRKGLSKQVIANILTQALAMTINQVTQAAKSKGISGNPLTALMDKNPQHLNLILAAAVNAATAKITNGEVKQLVDLPSIKNNAKPRQIVTKQEMKKPTQSKAQSAPKSAPKPAKAPTPPIKTTLGSSFDPTSLSKFFQPKQAVRTISSVPTSENKVIPSKRTRDDTKANNDDDSDSSSSSSSSDSDDSSSGDSDSSDSDSDSGSGDSGSDSSSDDESDDDSNESEDSDDSDANEKAEESENEDEEERERKKLKSQESVIESLLEEEDNAFDFPNDLDDAVGELDDDDVGELDFS